MTASYLILILLIMLYGMSFLVHLGNFLNKETKSINPNLLFEIGFLLHTFLIFTEARETQFFLPVTTMREVLIFFAWSLAFVFVILLRRIKQESFGVVLIPFLLSFLAVALVIEDGKAIPTTYFSDHYFLVHILSAFFAYASFTLSFVASVLYLIQSRLIKSKQLGSFYHKLPPLNELEKFIVYAIVWGLFLLGIGILSGFLWAHNALKSFSLMEPKTISSLVTWVAYGIIFFLYHFSVIRGKRSAKIVSFTFALVLFTFLGTSLFQNSLHIGM